MVFMARECVAVYMVRLAPYRWRYSLSAPHGMLAVACLCYVLVDRGSLLTDACEVAVPATVSLVGVVFGVRLRRAGCDYRRIRRMVAWSWLGLAASALAGGWLVAVDLTLGLPVVGIGDHLLTLLSFGSGAGLVVGRHRGAGGDARRGRAGTRVLAETTWVWNGDEESITVAVAETLAEVEGVDPTELDFALYEYVDPDVFDRLGNRETPWQLSFRVDGREVSVSSYGTVTVFDGNATEDSPGSAGATE